MKCPKCGHEQPQAPSCDACDIVFEKYWQRQKALQQQAYGELDESEPPERGWLKPLGVVLTAGAVVVLAVTLWPRDPVPDAQRQGVATRTSPPDTAGVGRTGGANPVSEQDLARARSASADRTKAVQYAREGTVFIKTAWGLGSGFFATDDCRIVTNRHVVELPEDALDKAERALSEQEQKLGEFKVVLEARRAEFLSTCSDCSSGAYQQYVGQYQREHAQAESELRRRRSVLADLRLGSRLEVTLADGTTHDAQVAYRSEDLDLAVVDAGLSDCVVLADVGASEPGLAAGDRLFAIGAPVGLKQSVTAGIFSGMRDFGGISYIQTDTAINPGNSGGPLINESGQVVGINTMIVRKASGLGFAIPFSYARSALNLP